MSTIFGSKFCFEIWVPRQKQHNKLVGCQASETNKSPQQPAPTTNGGLLPASLGGLSSLGETEREALGAMGAVHGSTGQPLGLSWITKCWDFNG